jgi:hypothetical protein
LNGLEIALSAVVATLLLGGVAVGAGFYFRWRAYQQKIMNDALLQLTAVLTKHNGSLELYLASIEKAKGAMETVPALLSGMLKISQAQVKEIGAFRGEVKNLRDMIFKKDGNRVEMPSDAEKDFVFRASELATEKGISFEQALKFVIEEDARGLVGETEFTL